MSLPSPLRSAVERRGENAASGGSRVHTLRSLVEKFGHSRAGMYGPKPRPPAGEREEITVCAVGDFLDCMTRSYLGPPSDDGIRPGMRLWDQPIAFADPYGTPVEHADMSVRRLRKKRRNRGGTGVWVRYCVNSDVFTRGELKVPGGIVGHSSFNGSEWDVLALGDEDAASLRPARAWVAEKASAGVADVRVRVLHQREEGRVAVVFDVGKTTRVSFTFQRPQMVFTEPATK